MLLNFMSDQSSGLNGIVIRFIKSLNVKITGNTIQKNLQSHPDYPSLLSVSETLSKFNIETLAVNIAVDQFIYLPQPFIAIQNDQRNSFVIVEKIDSQHTQIRNENGKKSLTDTDSFLKLVTGTVLIAEPTERSSEEDYPSKLRKYFWQEFRFPLILGLLFILGLFQIYFNYKSSSVTISTKIYVFSLFVLSFVGLIVSSLLIWYEFDQSNDALKKVCTISKKTNCSAILNSKASKLFNIISWSEIGFFYFAGYLIYMCLNRGTLISIDLLALLTVVCISYSIFSLFYQGFIAKQWCILCLCSQAVLILQFILTLLMHNTFYDIFKNFRFLDLDILIIAYLISPAFWLLFKPFIYKAKNAEEVTYSLARFKTNDYIFKTLLEKETTFTVAPKSLGIFLGNPESKNILLKICNPFCSACSKSYRDIEALVRSSNNWRVQIVFIVPDSDLSNTVIKVVAHFLAIYKLGDEMQTLNALADWYNSPQKDYSTFSAKYQINSSLEYYIDDINAMNSWCRNEKILFTPTYYINKHKMPDQYSIEDLYFL